MIAIFVVLSGLAVADWVVRNAELRQLVSATETANEAIAQWEAARDEILAELPSAHFITPELRQQSEQQIARAAADATAPLVDAAAAVRDVAVSVPWHVGIVRARDHYAEYIDAWIAHLERLAGDPASYEDPATQVAAARSATVRAFDEALPPMALFELGDRINALFA